MSLMMALSSFRRALARSAVMVMKASVCGRVSRWISPPNAVKVRDGGGLLESGTPQPQRAAKARHDWTDEDDVERRSQEIMSSTQCMKGTAEMQDIA